MIENNTDNKLNAKDVVVLAGYAVVIGYSLYGLGRLAFEGGKAAVEVIKEKKKTR